MDSIFILPGKHASRTVVISLENEYIVPNILFWLLVFSNEILVRVIHQTVNFRKTCHYSI